MSKDNLAALVTEVSLRYKELNLNKEVEFNITIKPEPLSLYFDREIVTMILDNLISNAAKYTEKGYINISLYTTRKMIRTM